MKSYVQAHVFDVWNSIESGYTEPSTPPIDDASRKLNESSGKAINIISSGLTSLVYVKVMYYKFTK